MELLTPIWEEDDDSPLYIRLYRYIQEEIRTGRLAYHEKLPSKRKLAAHLGISQNTVEAAYGQLMEEGYLFSRERSGYYVSKIDHLVQLHSLTPAQAAAAEGEAQAPAFDFSFTGVDRSHFPFNAWRKLLKEAVNEYDEDLLIPGDSKGHPQLRQSIADYLHQSRGVRAQPKQIVVGSGIEFLIQALIQLFPKDYVYGIENPGYEKLHLLYKSHAVTYRALSIDEDGMMPQEILASGSNVICVTPAHQFPTGRIMSIRRKAQLLNWAGEEAGRYIIEDDYDSEFKFTGLPLPALQGQDGNDRVIYLSSFSKSFSPAVRISYMVLPLHLVQAYSANLPHIICPVSVVVQKAMARFIQEGYFERHLNRMRKLYRRKRELLVEAVRTWGPAAAISGAEAGLHLLLEVSNGMGEEELVESARALGVRVYGLSRYYVKRQTIKKPTVLIGYGAVEEEDLLPAMDRLREAWLGDLPRVGR